jgi:DNA-directed RNA polymerase specialized sigma24 family protein
MANNNLTDYINTNYKELKKVVKNITKNNELADDLYHYCLVILLEYDRVKMDEIVRKNHVKYFFISILLKQWNSSTSPFYKEYRKSVAKSVEYFEIYDLIDEEYDHEIDDKIAFIKKELENESWYTQQVMKLKGEDGLSYGDINKLTKIPRSSLFGTVDNFRTKVKEKYVSSKV